MKAASPLLGQRALNRALLARQLLLRRRRRSATFAIEALVGMQAQEPLAPYVGLWTRLHRFRAAELSTAISERRVVRVPLMRGTIHMVTAEDCLALRPVVQPVLLRGFHTGSAFGKRLAGMDLAPVLAAGRAALAERPRSNSELRELLGRRWPERDAEALAMAIRYLVPVVQVPPRGLWGQGGQASISSVEAWLGRPLADESAPDLLVLRYLGAFGPASLLDVQAWSGLARLGEALERLRPRLRCFRDPSGRELFDLPDAPRPDADTPAPVRFLPEYDNLLLAHGDRSRVVSDEHRQRISTSNGRVPGAILVDGFVRGMWRIERERERDAATLVIEPFARISRPERAQLGEEGERLLAFAAAEATARELRFVPARSQVA